MKFVIAENGEERELHYHRPNIAEDIADDLIGGSGAVGDYIKIIPGSDRYIISQEDYQWWADYIEMTGRWEDQLDALRERYGADNVANVISRFGLELGADYNQHDQEYAEMIRTVREMLEEDINEA